MVATPPPASAAVHGEADERGQERDGLEEERLLEEALETRALPQ
jgi:hypothetical protein